MNNYITKCEECIMDISECPIRESQIERGMTPSGCNLIPNNTKSEREEINYIQSLDNSFNYNFSCYQLK